jgi:ribose/xylose/arabinose/galactoside ABC-type transport system permease subunit
MKNIVKLIRKYTVVLVLILLMVIFSFVSPYFLTLRNLINIITQNTYFIIVAVGLSFVMIGGGIDLSVGYQMSLVGVVTAMGMTTYQLPVWLSVLIGILLGTLLGFINGMIIVKIKVFPLIVTLATSTVFQGISYIISQAKTYRGYPPEFLVLTKPILFGIPLDVFLTLFIVLLAAFIYNKTSFGWNILALGGNEEASRLAGINTKVMRVVVYTLCGFFVSIATMVMISKANTTSSMFGPGTEFTALTAAIVGGISFMGGEGGMLGLVTGVFLLAVLGNGMQLAGWGTYAQYIVKGMILLGAVTFDEFQKNLRVKVGTKQTEIPEIELKKLTDNEL